MKPDDVILSNWMLSRNGDGLPKSQTTVEESDLVDVDVVMFFVCAGWLPLCREAATLLINAWDRYLIDYKMRVVLLSYDRGDDDFEEYVAESNFPWTWFFARKELASRLMRAYAVKGMPSIVAVKRDGTVKCRITNVVSTLKEAGEGVTFQDVFDRCIP